MVDRLSGAAIFPKGGVQVTDPPSYLRTLAAEICDDEHIFVLKLHSVIRNLVIDCVSYQRRAPSSRDIARERPPPASNIEAASTSLIIGDVRRRGGVSEECVVMC
jgi:hypothetical protein